ncbi:MAG TPA: serine/threonine-protein kinase, partial [Planctomycetota bacterium]|nr:serine/threonine-protein kinase [Planctomycetota bacterium]
MEPTSPQHDPRATADAETFAAEFLAREDQGLAPTLDVYVAGLPPEHRDDCRERIVTATRARGVLRELRRSPLEPADEPPSLRGFRIERLIGRGGVGAVYAAWDETLERPVAIKVLRRGAAADVRERVIREARKAAGIQDAGIVTVYSVIDEGEEPAIVMELVEGHPIDRAAAALGFREKAKLLQAVARALSVAHERGVIHRDLKPENVIVTPDLRPKVVDFGLAVDVGEEEGPGRFFKGTPLYASPEQAAARSLTPASDVFSFGSLMFTVLAGKPPFQGVTVEEVFERIAACEPPFPRTISSDIPEDLQAVCLACLAKEPQDRPSAADVAADIGRYLVGEPVRSRPSLYRDILRRRISAHSSELGDWECQGMISSQEKDRLDVVYRRILADEDHWIVDARKFTPAQTILYTGSWVTV